MRGVTLSVPRIHNNLFSTVLEIMVGHFPTLVQTFLVWLDKMPKHKYVPVLNMTHFLNLLSVYILDTVLNSKVEGIHQTCIIYTIVNVNIMSNVIVIFTVQTNMDIVPFVHTPCLSIFFCLFQALIVITECVR